MKKKKLFSGYIPQIRSRHPSHSVLRGRVSRMPFRSVIRLGSTTELFDSISNGGKRIEVNTVQAIKNASNKLLMKKAFTEEGIKTANWYTYSGDDMFTVEFDIERQEIPLAELPYPIVSKHIFGSRGRGNTKLNTPEELESWMKGKTLSNYIFEKFYNYSREYRLHVTEEGCFYTCRKMLKTDTPDNLRWFRNDANSVWILEKNEAFDKPVNWDCVIEDSVKALESVGLDVGAVDLKIQSRLDSKGNVRENPEYIVLEINSAPSFGEKTAEKYLEQLPIILKRKQEE